jgi:hypothetical protein
MMTQGLEEGIFVSWYQQDYVMLKTLYKNIKK